MMEKFLTVMLQWKDSSTALKKCLKKQEKEKRALDMTDGHGGRPEKGNQTEKNKPNMIMYICYVAPYTK